MSDDLLSGMPEKAPLRCVKSPKFADVGLPFRLPSGYSTQLTAHQIALTATAKDFAGIYRGKQYHEPDILAMLDRASAAGVEKVILTGMSIKDIDFNLKITRSRPHQCLMTVGVHPYHASEPENDPDYLNQMVARIRELVAMEYSPLAAFGELGLDYDHLEHAPRETQIRTFKAQLDLYILHKLNLPLFLHCRASFDDFVRIITPYLPHLPLPSRRGRGVVHSFVGNTIQMQKLIELGFQVSVNGLSFRHRDCVAMVREIPLTKLHLETDAPWGEIPANSEVAKRYLTNATPLLPPSKKRDKFEMGYAVKGRNESWTMERVALVVAGLKGIPVDQVMDAAWTNSQTMFGFPNR